MSAIGDYIHLTARGYINSKYSHKSENYTPIYYQEAHSVIKNREALLDNFLKSRHTQLIESVNRQLNDMLQMFQRKKVDLSKEEQILQESIMQDLLVRLNDEFTGVTLNLQKLEKGPQLLGRLKQIKLKETSLPSYTVLISKIEHAFQIINSALDQYKGKESLKIQNILANIQASELAFKNLKMEVESTLRQGEKSQGLSDAALVRYRKEILLRPENFSTFTSIIDTINSVIQSLKVSSNSLLSAAIGEEFVNLAMEQLYGTAINALGDTLISSTRTANNTKKSGYDLSYFTNNTNWSKVLENTSYTIENNNFIATMKSDIVKDKADITITSKKNNTLGIQVKNYPEYIASEYGLKMIDGAPFLALVQNENNDNFVNHYLNLRARHNTTKIADPQSYVARLIPEQQNISRVMSKLIMIKAATGKGVVGGANIATEVFVYIDRPGRGQAPVAHVRSMQSLIEQALAEDYNLHLPVSIKNEYAATPQDRIDNILHELHEYKIKWSITSEMVKAKKD